MKIIDIQYSHNQETRTDGRYPIRIGSEVRFYNDPCVGFVMVLEYIKDNQGNPKTGFLTTSTVKNIQRVTNQIIVTTNNSIYCFQLAECKEVSKKEQYQICNVGCDDETDGVFKFTKEQFDFLNNVFTELNQNSTYDCMPKIFIDRIDDHTTTDRSVEWCNTFDYRVNELIDMFDEDFDFSAFDFSGDDIVNKVATLIYESRLKVWGGEG